MSATKMIAIAITHPRRTMACFSAISPERYPIILQVAALLDARGFPYAPRAPVALAWKPEAIAAPASTANTNWSWKLSNQRNCPKGPSG